MKLAFKCRADDSELINDLKCAFDNVEIVESHSFGDISEFIILFVPFVSLTIQTLDFIFTHFSETSKEKERTVIINDAKGEYTFKGFSREEIKSLLESEPKK